MATIKSKLKKMTGNPKSVALKRLVKGAVPFKLGRPRKIGKLDMEKGSKTTASMIKSIKSAKSRLKQYRFK